MTMAAQLAHGKIVIAIALPVILWAAESFAADWPQWLGPERNGISRETGWSAEGSADDVWRASVGVGYSCVAIGDGRLYTMGYDAAAEQDTVHCLDAGTGREIWTHSYPAEIWNRGHKGGTLSTPSIDGDLVYTLNREGKFHCFNASDGTVIFSKDVVADFAVTPPTWGFSASPLILDDGIILNLGHVLAVKKRTGEEMWRTRDLGHAYSTPATLTIGDRECLAVFNSGGLAVIDRITGQELCFHEWKTKYDVNAASPVVVDGRKVFISSGLNRGCALLECLPDGMSVVWESKIMRTKMSGCIQWEGHLYGFDESVLKCIDLEGNEMWRERGIGNGSLMIADGRLIVIGSKGELIIAEASSEGFSELSRAKCLDGGVYWTMPLLADGLIYCRSSEGTIVCRDHRTNLGLRD